jgi:3-oxoacyl-[acyl-carrier-protein] synthase-3
MINPVYITEFGAFLPNAPISNDQIVGVLGLTGSHSEKVKQIILRNNGIKTRYYAYDSKTGKSTHSNAQMTRLAVLDLVEKAKFDLKDLDCLACGTTSPDQWVPNHASMVHGELKNPPCEVMSPAGVCCTAVAALKYAYLNVATGGARNAIVTGSEHVSSLTNEHQFELEPNANKADPAVDAKVGFEQEYLRWMLSDGAGAALLETKPRPGKRSLRIDWIDFVSFANELPVCMYSGGVKEEDGEFVTWRNMTAAERSRRRVHNLSQDSRLLGKNVITATVYAALSKTLERHPMKPQDIDWFLPHFSSHVFKQEVYDNLVRADFELPYEKWFTNLTTRGNTGAASIFLMLEEFHASDMPRPGQRILCWVPESARFSAGFIHLTVVE